MAKTRKTAQRQRAKKAANIANMAILEKQASEPQPENPKKIRIDGEASAKQSSAPQPGTSKGFGEETFVKPMDLSQTYKESIITVQLSEASTWSNSVQRPTNPSEVKLLEDNDTTDDESPDEATVHEEQVADENRFQEFEDQAGRDSDDLHNECNEKIVSLENQISKLSEEIITLKDHKARLEKQNWMLQVKIVQDNDKRTLFTVNTEKDGYPSLEWLIKASTVANDSDYLFVKQLMLFLWPKGIDRHATTSGRTSNNPKGAKKQTDTEETAGPSKKASTAASGDPSVQIDPEKVNFIKDCLFQRREILGDDHGMANSLAKKAVQHINRVLANNPNMKNNNKI